MSNCVDCGVEKTQDNCNKNKNYTDGFRPRCKDCMTKWTKAYEKSPKGYLVRSYRNIESRVNGVQKRKHHLYDNFYILPRKEFYNFSLNDEKFLRLLASYRSSGWKPSKAPSLDRIYPWFGYHADNIRWVSQADNSGHTRGATGNSSLWYDEDNIHFVSDLHFLHRNIIKYNREYCDNVDEMNELIVKEWNAVVKPNDLVFDLGDLSMGSMKLAKSLLIRLNGFIVHLKGNHNGPKEYEFFAEDNPKQLFLDSPYLMTVLNGLKIVMCHYPLVSWDDMHKGSIHLYGHCHGSLGIADKLGKSLDVGIDNTYNRIQQLRPISLAEVRAYMETREVSCFDHHNEGSN